MFPAVGCNAALGACPADTSGKGFHATRKAMTEQGETAWMCSLHKLSSAKLGTAWGWERLNGEE